MCAGLILELFFLVVDENTASRGHFCCIHHPPRVGFGMVMSFLCTGGEGQSVQQKCSPMNRRCMTKPMNSFQFVTAVVSLRGAGFKRKIVSIRRILGLIAIETIFSCVSSHEMFETESCFVGVSGVCRHGKSDFDDVTPSTSVSCSSPLQHK